MKELREMSEVELLQTDSKIIAELRRRDVVKTLNNPVAGYTEWLVCNHLKLHVEENSRAGFDAKDPQEGVRYEIKGTHATRKSVQFSAIRNLEGHLFDFLIAVAFNEDYSIRFAVKIPHKVVLKLARFQSHVNAHILRLTDDDVEQDGVEDIRHRLD